MKKMYEESNIKDIANAIREKNGSTNTYKPSEMASAIRGIEVGGGEEVFFSSKGMMYKVNTVVLTNATDTFATSGYSECKEMKTFSAPYFISRAVANYVFQGCSFLISASLPRYKHYGINFFYNCKKLETLELGSEEYPVVDIRLNAFVNCIALKNVAIVGNIGSEGNVATITFDNSTELTAQSTENILLALGDLNGTGKEFTVSIKFPPTVWDRVNAEGNKPPNGETWQGYANSKGWNI